MALFKCFPAFLTNGSKYPGQGDFEFPCHERLALLEGDLIGVIWDPS